MSATPTLGPVVGAWIQAHCAIPDGPHAGEPYLLTDEQWRFVDAFYAVHPGAGAWVYDRGAQLVRPQKWGKSPFAAAIICAEAAGPVRFAQWARGGEETPWGYVYAHGEPMGARWASPWVQVTAVSEDQTANTWRALQPMVELGQIAHEIPDSGLTRINLPNGGRIEPVTSSHRSRLGQRVTFACQDETHAWLDANGGRMLADNQRRNLAGMGGRWLETTNAWDPAEESVAQTTAEGGEPGVYRDDREPGEGSIRNKAERRRMLRKVYADAAAGCPAQATAKAQRIEPWIDLDRIESEIVALLDRDAPQAERYFLNRKRASESVAFPAGAWDALARPRNVEPRSLVVAGVDGARFSDALAIVACEVASGHLWTVGVWERPSGAGDDYEHPLHEADGALTELVERFGVWRVYVDPQWIDSLVHTWQGRWGEKRVIPWHTNRPRQAAAAVRRFAEAIGAGDLTHDGDATFTRHVKNAQRRKVRAFDEEHRQLWTISKDRPDSPRKIDAAMAAVLAWEARGDAIAADAKPPRARTGRAMFV